MCGTGVFRLQSQDAVRYVRLRRRMLLDAPWAFSASPENDRGLDLAFLEKALAADTQAIFAIEASAPSAASERRALAAAAGVLRQVSPKFDHRANIWGVFVAPEHRHKGLGRAVVAAAIDWGCEQPGVDYVDLGASERAEDARRLYESLGFAAWGREPEATEVDGRRYDEIHMTLRLRARAQGR